MITKDYLASRLQTLVLEKVSELKTIAEETFLDEVALKRVVRGGKIVKKAAVKKKGFKVVRKGNQITFKRITQKEKRVRRKAARKAWRTGKSSRLNKGKRTLKRSKIRMKMLYHTKKKK